ERYQYPVSRLAVEYGVNFGREVKRADIIILDRDRPTVPYIIIEVKKPNLKDGKNQLRSYCNATGASIGVWTNGDQISYYQRKDPNYFNDISDLPNVYQTLADILDEKFTLEDLIAHDKLKEQRKSLKTLIEEMEDEVLANAGVDVFEEIFKLIFTKLYDEWYSGQGNRRKNRQLEFRNTGQTEGALKNKIQSLFDKAKQKWEGVFSEDSKVTLTPSHLAVCVSSLEDVKLFNSNLDVVDEAFEYLINQSSKGEKGQYFTPRYVIDMCVKMLNPQEDEYTIDTAAGSSGFPVHTIFYVWKQILEDEGIEASHLFSVENKPPRCEEYVTDKVFAIDFDEKAVRVARTLNLIAGDGQTNVLHLNTLDYELWDEVTNDKFWQDIYFEGFKRLRKRQPKGSKDYREFQFDVLMANPPFAGDIKESRIIARYDLGKKPNGKWENKLGRDILFIERNLDFLKPGGRMAIVLPQGRFNNSSDKTIRDYISERCRILAVVGLHGNTFKPHTGTKTSVLFVQKWNNDPKLGALCPRQDDYNIFFATMRRSGKDNSGEKIYRRIPPSNDTPLNKGGMGGSEFLLDPHDHLIVDHDLYNHDGMTEDGIAEAFIEFAKKEKLSFFKSSPSMKAFDVEKYQRLMDGLEIIEVLFSKTLENKDFRIDSEFHRKPPVQNPNYHYVNVEETLTLSQYGISMEMNEDGDGTKIYRMNEIHNMLCDTEVSKFANITPEEIKAFKLEDRDILFNRTNSFEFVGRTGLFKKFSNEDLVFASYLIRVRTDENKILPEYLVTFLNSSLGVWDVKRRARISINQSNVNAQELAAVKIPLLDVKFQVKLKQIFEQAHQDRLEAIYIYQQAEELLLSELGLQDWQPTDENIAIKSFTESFGKSARLDAEHYQPKYEQAEKAIEESGLIIQKLGDLIHPIQNGFDYRDFIDVGTPYIRVGDIKQGTINVEDAAKVLITIADVNKPIKLQVGDILFTRKGSFGNSAVVDEQSLNAIISSEIMLVRLTSKSNTMILPEYISLFLNSKFGYLQVERRVHGVAYYSISQDDLADISIPIMPLSKQREIVQKIKSSFELKERSKQLLEIAKTGVEKAIEENEEKAIDWMNQELKKLEIDLSTENLFSI
ncbi:MAG: N-6 DNA methylase, partial [Xenococcaceae cyanobacterium]